jgi:peroxiredoxin
MNKTLLVLAIGLVVAAAGCSGSTETTAPPVSAPADGQEAVTGSAVGNLAPDFSLRDVKGNTVTLRSDGEDQQVTMLVFWATWCPACREEIPEVSKFFGKYSDRGVRTLSVNVDRGSSGVASFVEKADIDYPVLLDGDSSVAASYNVRGIPNVLILDKSGIVRYNGHSVGSAEKEAKVWLN